MKTQNRDKSGFKELTEGQIDCLILVSQQLTSKEIGPILGISPHTVDQRVRRAMRTLNVDRRADAARIVSAEFSRGLFNWPDDRPEDLVSSLPDRVESIAQLPLPIPTKRRPTNELTVGQRLLWIATIAMGAAFSMGVYLAGLESLARMLRGA
jgi:DNA-binding CsgD family transcriptional regulator